MLEHKIDRAIKIIRQAARAAKQQNQVIELCYSGGKDSDIILNLAKMAKVPYRAIYKATTIDPRGTIAHVIANNVEIVKPKKTFLQLISERGFPSSYGRFCCHYLKEYKILDFAILGIRRSESTKRQKIYKEYEQCRVFARHEMAVHQYYPILDWDDNDVVEFIMSQKIQCHPIYYNENGEFDVTKRVGCMCCPLISRRKRIEQFKKYKNMVKLYIKGGGDMLIITQLS